MDVSVEILTELVNKVDALSKKVDKLVSLNTKIAKTLHLLPVTEREEKEIQLLQRKNLHLAAKVNDDLNAMEPPADIFPQLSIESLQIEGVFSDVLGNDYLNKDVV